MEGQDGLERPAERFRGPGLRRQRSDCVGRGKGARLFRQTCQTKYRTHARFGTPGSRPRNRRRISDRLADLQQPRLHQCEQGRAGRLDQDAAASGYVFGYGRTQGRTKSKRRKIADRLYRITRGAERLRRCWRTARPSRRQVARSHARARRHDVQRFVSYPRRTGEESRTLDKNVRRVFSLKLPSPQWRRVRNGTIDGTNRKETNLDQRVLRQYTGAELDWLVEPSRQSRERIHKPRLLGRRGPDRRARLV